MKTTFTFILTFLATINLFSQITIQRVNFKPNNISTYFQNTGIFNQNSTISSAGFEWPAGSQKFAVFTSGVSMACKISDNLAFVSASYRGEFAPGTFVNGNFITNPNFKIYSVKSFDNCSNNPDYANWGLMVPYGAPYKDVNQNGQYDCGIDIPGYPNASQTIFMCLGDGDLSQKSTGEGFSGGVFSPLLKVQAAITAWGYDNPGFENVQFVKYHITNKNNRVWNGFHLGLMVDADIGDAVDDRSGCDTTKDLGFVYNGSNVDLDYGANPPAVGFLVLRSPFMLKNGIADSLGMSSFATLRCGSCAGPVVCNSSNNTPNNAYNLMRGFKNDGTPILNPTVINGTRKTKYCFSGDPESSSGWNETVGFIRNCEGDTSMTAITQILPGNRRFLLNSGDDSLSINPGQSFEFVFAQYIERGISNLNSVTRLKNKVSAIKTYYNYVSGSVNISALGDLTPQNYELFQNYPNPFNPETKIKFDISKTGSVSLEIYDITGKLIERLANKNLSPGSYEYIFNGSALSSGIYYYKLSANNFSQTKKMLLLK
ncbi:MAG TPA: T9SS type A sorting domain-containing protein [Ignavibacteria bacterium]|nr:T9SS type A sorting domain-containing protein [Ignavibacteria bacterium]